MAQAESRTCSLNDPLRIGSFIVFGDKTIKDMVIKKSSTLGVFAEVFAVGKQKLDEYGEVFTQAVREYLGQA